MAQLHTPRVTLLSFEGWPNLTVADERLCHLVDEHGFTVEQRKTDTPEDAERVGVRGSPTILVDGVGPFAVGDEPVGLSCRVYVTKDGPQGSPTLAQLRPVLA